MNGIVLQQIIQKSGIRHRTATQHVAECLREAIAAGALTEGEALVQDEMAAALGVSRTPIREALRLLEAEGWIDFHAHRGAVVSTLSADEVRQIFEIRFALESLALRQSVPHLDAAAFDRLAGVLRELDVETDAGAWLAAHRRFHMGLYAHANARLRRLIEEQHNGVERYLRIEFVAMNTGADDSAEHRAILEACRLGDVDAAIRLSEPHIVGGGADLADALDRRRRADAS
jgi:DNA-binding GntR family transcriptional regulator